MSTNSLLPNLTLKTIYELETFVSDKIPLLGFDFKILSIDSIVAKPIDIFKVNGNVEKIFTLSKNYEGKLLRDATVEMSCALCFGRISYISPDYKQILIEFNQPCGAKLYLYDSKSFELRNIYIIEDETFAEFIDWKNI